MVGLVSPLLCSQQEASCDGDNWVLCVSAAGRRRKALLKPVPNCLLSATPYLSNAISCGILWLVTLVRPPALGVIKCALWWPKYAS